jgi:hypothetical protein
MKGQASAFKYRSLPCPAEPLNRFAQKQTNSSTAGSLAEAGQWMTQQLMKVVIPEPYRELRAAVPFDSVSIGYSSIHLAPVKELEAAQQGYSIVPEGDETDWREEWVVVGYEGMCGDPIFIDTDDDEYPVYTAEHGMGEWSPRLIAFTFRHFVQILEKLRVLARGRSNPMELERHPITERDLESFMEFIRRDSPDVDFAFWKGLCGTEK